MTPKTSFFPKRETDPPGLRGSQNPSEWQPLAEESFLPGEIAPEKSAHLLHAMNPAKEESPWRRALQRVGIRWLPDLKPILKQGEAGWQVRNNWIVDAITAGTRKSRGFRPLLLRLLRIPRLILFHIRLEVFLIGELEGSAPNPKLMTADEARTRSLALGLAALALTQRLPRHTPAQLARWLADPTGRSLKRLRELERRRLDLRWAWKEWTAKPSNTPLSDSDGAERSPVRKWQGVSVVPQPRTAEYTLLEADDPKPAHPAAFARYFPNAHPDTVTRFGETELILYASGSVLCHACTVAREQRQACITQLGKAFLWAVSHNGKSGSPKKLRVNLDTGEVELV